MNLAAQPRSRYSDVARTTAVPPPTVLLAADALTRAAIGRVLARDGFHVLEARDGTELAWRLEVSGDDIDLVIADVAAPRLAGYDVLARIRRVDRATPIILIAGRGDASLYAGADALGVIAVLERPLDVLGLRSILRTYRMKEI